MPSMNADQCITWQMALPWRKKKFVSWSSIDNTKQNSIFIFKCKNKKVIYMDVWVYVFFLIEKTILVAGCQVWGAWLGSLDWMRAWGYSTRNVGYLGLSFLGFPCPLCRSRCWAGSRWDGTACHHPALCLALEDEYLSTRVRTMSWLVNLNTITDGGGGRCYWGYIFLVGLACH